MALRAKRLKNLVIEENSGVDAPAHLVPGWSIRKSAGTGTVDEFLDALLKQLETEQEDVPMTLVELLTKAKDGLADAEKAQVEAFLKSLEGKGPDPDPAVAAATTAAEEAKKAQAAAEERAAKAEAALKALAGGGTVPDPAAEELAKALATLPEPVRKAIEAQEARIAKAEAATAEAVKKADEERDARLSAEYLEKAKGLRGLPGKPEDVATLLRKAEQGQPLATEDIAELNRLLKAASNAIEKSDDFKEFGGAGADVSGDTQAQANALADEIQKADPNVARSTAMVRAYHQLDAKKGA